MARRDLVLYVQLTLGPAHLARVRALDAVPGLACTGIQLASRERTRHHEIAETDRARVRTVSEGVYEELSLHQRVLSVWRLLKELGPDSVIVDAPADPVQRVLAVLARRLGALTFTRWASTRHDYSRSAAREWLKGFVYRGFDGYLATGSRSAAYAASFGVPEDRIHVCGNPIDEEPIRIARAQRGGIEREQSFLFVGRFLPHKNLERLVRAYARYRAAGGDWSLRLVGSGETEARVRAAARGVPGISLEGHRRYSELASLYASCGALILPSVSENWGLVVAEAMTGGMPVLISTACGCFPELVEGVGSGFGFAPDSEEEIEASLTRFSRLSGPERELMGRRAAENSGESVEAWADAVANALGRARSHRSGQ